MGIGAVVYNPQNPNSILIAAGEGYGFGNEFTAGYGILISHDGGKTWDTTSVAASLSQNFAGMDIYWNGTDTTKVCAVASFSLYYSDDGGSSWTTVSTSGYIGTFEYDKLNNNLVYAHRSAGSAMYKSIDGGDNWTLLSSSSGNPITDLATDPFNMGTVYATIGSFGADEQLFVSYESGFTWDNISNNLPEVPANTIAINEHNNRQLYVGNDLGVWVSEDSGASWTAFNEGLPAAVVVEDLHYYGPDSTIRIGTYGRGY